MDTGITVSMNMLLVSTYGILSGSDTEVNVSEHLKPF